MNKWTNYSCASRLVSGSLSDLPSLWCPRLHLCWGGIEARVASLCSHSQGILIEYNKFKKIKQSFLVAYVQAGFSGVSKLVDEGPPWLQQSLKSKLKVQVSQNTAWHEGPPCYLSPLKCTLEIHVWEEGVGSVLLLGSTSFVWVLDIFTVHIFSG